MEEGRVFASFSERWKALANEQKIALGILGVCGAVAFGFSIYRVNANITRPFTVSADELEKAQRKTASIDVNTAKLEEQKRRDTDGDGMSDYDEEKMYGTSPYLMDTDGDGVNDNVELATGQNPNCAKGQACSGTMIDYSMLDQPRPFFGQVTTGTSDQLIASFQRGMEDSKKQIIQNTGSTSTVLQPALIRDPVEIRRVIAESGKIDMSIVNALSDQELLDLYDKAIVEAAGKEIEGLSP